MMANKIRWQSILLTALLLLTLLGNTPLAAQPMQDTATGPGAAEKNGTKLMPDWPQAEKNGTKLVPDWPQAEKNEAKPMPDWLQEAPAIPGPTASPNLDISSRWTCTPPMIDGVADIFEWMDAPVVSMQHGELRFLNDGSNLYLLMDIRDDTQDDPIIPNDPWGDYFHVTFDVDQNMTVTAYTDIDYGLYPSMPHSMGFAYYIRPNTMTGLYSTTGSLGVGFGPSMTSPAPHRIWEFAFPFQEIGASQGGQVRMGFRDHSQNPDFEEDLPLNFFNDFTNLVQVRLPESPCGIQIAKHTLQPQANPGDILTYYIDYTMTFPGLVYTDVVIVDPLPPGLTYLPGSSPVPPTVNGNMLLWRLGNLQGGTNGTLEFQVLVDHQLCGGQEGPIMLGNAAHMVVGGPPQQANSNGVVTQVACRPVDFPSDEPPYAESEITIHPYPIVAGRLTRACTTIHNSSAVSQTVEVTFELANLGVGLAFSPISAPGNPRTITIPPGGSETICILWTPTVPGHQCMQVVLRDPNNQWPEIHSQRNLDVNEVLVPGQPSTFTIPVANNSQNPIMVGMVIRNNCPGWLVEANPASFSLDPDVQVDVQVTVTPGFTVTLGSGCTVDIEAWEINADSQLVRLIGGVRKFDDPQPPLGDPGERSFAEREIRVYPYPLVSGQTTELCVNLVNSSDLVETVTVEFQMANFGIGLPFNLITTLGEPNPQQVVLPPHTAIDACIHFRPSTPGHHCLAVKMTTSTGYVSYSRRNFDVAELLEPGVPELVPISVGNPTTTPADITLAVDNTCPGWMAWVQPPFLPGVGPNSGDIRTVTMTVIPAPGLLGSGCHIDLMAYINGQLIGGVRKVDRPPIAPPLTEPPYAEQEIRVSPDPPIGGQDAWVYVDLQNPTAYTQTVDITFAEANLGTGYNFSTIATATNFSIPPNVTATVVAYWKPSGDGPLDRCLRFLVHQDGYIDLISQINIHLVAWPFGGGNQESAVGPFGIQNSRSEPVQMQVWFEEVGLVGVRTASLRDTTTNEEFAPGDEIPFAGDQVRTFMLVLETVTGTTPAMIGEESYVDVLPYVDGQPLKVDGVQSGVRFVMIEGATPTGYTIYLPIVIKNQ